MIKNPKMPNTTQPPNLLSGIQKPMKVPVILRNTPRHLAGIDVGLVPIHELARGHDIRGNRFLGQDVFPCLEGFFDEFGLDWDW